MPSSIEIKHVTKQYQVKSTDSSLLTKIGLRADQASNFHAISDIDITLTKGSFTTIFGPNGSGKSTLFKIISGLEQPTTGAVTIGKKPVSEARIGFVFQNYRDSMLTWRTALGNVKLALEARGVPVEKRDKLALEYLDKVNMAHIAKKPFYSLSGGQAQLVSIARAFAYQPDILLMDEPFSALDFQTSLSMMETLSNLWQSEKITTLFISHDVDEAVYLADQVIVMNPNPGSIRTVVPVKLKRPRPITEISSPEFYKIRTKVLEEFRKGLKK